MPVLAADSGSSISVPVLLIVLIIAGIIYTFGYLRAVMHRANRDYKTIKKGVKPARKAFWLALWGATKIGFWVIVAFLCLFAWVIHDVRGKGAEADPKPSTSTSQRSTPHPSTPRSSTSHPSASRSPS